MKARLTICLIVSLLLAIVVSVQATEWPMYRHDNARNGKAESDAFTNTRPVPVWVWPVPEKGVAPVDNDVIEPIQDVSGTVVKDDANFTMTGQWLGADSSVSPNAYQGNYVYARGGTGATASWEFRLPDQNARTLAYYIYVWFPSRAYMTETAHAENAPYTVEIVNDNGTVASTDLFEVDQTSGGTWIVLTTRPYMVRDDQWIRVSLSTDGVDADKIVCADGVSLGQDLGSVLSSPALATNGSSQRDDDLVVTCLTENRPLETVSIDVPEIDQYGSPIYENGELKMMKLVVQSGSVRVGRVCGIAAEDSGNTIGFDDRGQLQWKFPRTADNWVVGGFSSSPVIHSLGGVEAAYCPAQDGQLYVVKTTRGTLADSARILWQGPGYINDDPDAPSWAAPALLNSGRYGDDYLQKLAVAPGGTETTATWDFDINEKDQYSFQAWIPPSSNAAVQISDAKYTITIGTTKYTATADQRSGGRWALLGKYQVDAGDTVNVELSNVSESMRDPTAGARYATADAIKVVPSHLGVFDWSSPAVSADGTKVYIGSTGGRLYCFDVSDPNNHDPDWIYPDPNDAVVADRNPIGEIEASPTLDGGKIYIGSTDGHVYCISAATGKLDWVYPSKAAASDGTFRVLGQISSSIAVYGDKLYFGVGSDSLVPPFATGSDTAGRIICLDKNNPAAPDWMYPAAADEARGSFLWSSPLMFDDNIMAIGSSDGYLIGLDTAGNTIWADGFPDLGQEIYSSPAGAMVTAEAKPMAYVGTQGGTLHGVDLQYGRKHWSYGLLGAVVSSPAIAEERLYVGDMSGITWAFSSRKGSGAGGMEGWNEDIGISEPPGNDNSASSDIESSVEVDIFTQEEWNSVKNGAKFVDGDLHLIARAENDYNPTYQPPPHDHRLAFPYEWGETVYVIAWNCLNPNDPEDPDAQWTSWTKKGDKFVPETDSTVRLTIKSRGPGDQSDQSTAVTMTEKGAIWDDKNDRPVFYTKSAYVLGTSSSSSTQAPGSRITAAVQELPSTKSDSPSKGATAGDCLVPEHDDKDPILPKKPNPVDPSLPDVYDHSKFKPQRVAINNPLGLVYDDPNGVDYLIAVNSDGTTSREPNNYSSLVHINGNHHQSMPWVRTGLVAHGSTSDERAIVACDRSLLNLTGNSLSKFRIERNDLYWTGGEDQIWHVGPVSTWLPWEDKPPTVGGGSWGSNASVDYPDIRGRQVNFTMAESRLDPTLEEARLRPGVAPNVPAGDVAWGVGKTPVAEVVAVPRFQPPNMPFIWPAGSTTALETSGYTGRVFTFIDSNSDGRLNRPGSLGSSSLYQQSVTGARAEAYREFYTQVHVPPDYRVEVGEKTFDIGAVPHGFGLTATGSPLPGLFLPTLGQNAKLELPTGGVTSGVFDQWFKSFTAYNEGNVNLLNIKLAKRVNARGTLYNLDLFSDTAEGAMYGPSPLTSYGAYIPAQGIVSALDPLFVGNAPFNPIMGLPSRTFHKPRVGELPTVLRLPDMPTRMYDNFSAPPAGANQPRVIPPLPFFSIAVPVGTPIGTYSQSLTLYDDVNGDNVYQLSESLGSPLMEAKITVTENRMTDGFIPGALPQVDTPITSISIGDVAPAVYKDSVGNLQMFWSSNRLGPANGGGGGVGGTPAAGDPWYIYKSSLALDSAGYWNLAVPAPPTAQWWMPITTPYPTPTAASLATFFDIDIAGNDKPGDVQRNSVKFSSPSIVQDPVNPASAWLFFGGEANRYQASPAVNAHEYKAFYWPLDANGNPMGNALSSTRDWTMPKYGVKGAAARVDGDLTLWTFWYGGNNSQWRIFYNCSPLPGQTVGTASSWSNDGQLRLPRGLVSAAEPSIIPRRALDEDQDPIDALDVVYSAYSQYRKNADIYLSRYEPDMHDITNGTVALDLVPLPRIRDEVLSRDPVSAIYNSRHVDWEPDADEFDVWVNGPGFAQPLRINRDSANVEYAHTRDQQTRALIFTYTGTAIGEAALKTLFRSVVVDPAAGTVKFLRDPGPRAIVTATYRPRAWRLTADEEADAGPCALFDTGPNPRYLLNPDGFYVPSGWSGSPSVDRLWVLWRRPSTATKGTSIYYKSFRHMLQMDGQITMNAGSNMSFSPEPAGPVEIDWARKRLYFTAIDDGKTFAISYPPALGSNDVTETHTVQLTEELDAQGSSFGNLTSEVANEGQVCAIRDPNPYFSKLWVFWTSARAGNTDVYYEAICPRFYAREFK